MSGKRRIDVLLVEKHLCESCEHARRQILAGLVRVGSDHVVRKGSELVKCDADIVVRKPYPYVSRGAEKLLPALDQFCPRLDELVALDVGASTGGFTDLMLQRGAARVYAVDVGRAQLHLKLREDPRVICLEKTNARNLSCEQIPEAVGVVTADVSFISLRKIIPALVPLARDGALFFLLIKPQFEAAREEVGRGGVVRDESVRERIVSEICAFAQNHGLMERARCPSPICGPKGNQEVIAVFAKASSKRDV